MADREVCRLGGGAECGVLVGGLGRRCVLVGKTAFDLITEQLKIQRAA